MNIRISAIILAAAICGLQASEDNLVKNPDFKEQRKHWIMNKDSIFEDGFVTVPLTDVRKKDPKTFTASICQNIRSIKPGKYEFSAYYKGDFRNLYVVLRGYDQNKKPVNIIAQWLVRKNFIPAGDKPGWYKFCYAGEVPEGIVRASIHSEPWGSSGQIIQLTGIELTETE